jgi:hypothetical protein
MVQMARRIVRRFGWRGISICLNHFKAKKDAEKCMKERILYNVYYSEFEDFKTAIFGFFIALHNMDSESELGKSFKSRVKDKFHLVGSPITDF